MGTHHHLTLQHAQAHNTNGICNTPSPWHQQCLWPYNMIDALYSACSKRATETQNDEAHLCENQTWSLYAEAANHMTRPLFRLTHKNNHFSVCRVDLVYTPVTMFMSTLNCVGEIRNYKGVWPRGDGYPHQNCSLEICARTTVSFIVIHVMFVGECMSVKPWVFKLQESGCFFTWPRASSLRFCVKKMEPHRLEIESTTKENIGTGLPGRVF